MKLIVFSVCKDEAETIGEVLDRIPDKVAGINELEKLVISDGSQDDTAKIAMAHGAAVIEGRYQKRLAHRFQQALDFVLSKNADIAVNIDGDLQFDPKDIPRLIKPIIDGEADFVAADRFTDPESGKRRRPENMPANKYWANRAGAWVIGKLSEYQFRDVTCGFRAYNRDAMLALNLNGKYTYTQESFQILAKKRKDIVSVPVEVKYYPGRKSRVVTSFTQFLFGSGLNILRAFRDFAPLRFFFYMGLIPFTTGFIFTGAVFWHWTQTGRTSPLQFMGFTGLYLLSLGIIIWIVGVLADMQDRNLNNQEKIIEDLKRKQYGKHQ